MTKTARPSTLYRVAIGLLCFVFIVSISLSVGDAPGTYAEIVRLGFPLWIVWPQTLAKALGVIALVWGRSHALRDFAFAGFLFDLLLAIGAHIAHGDAFVVVALISLAIWIFAYVMELRHRQAQTRTQDQFQTMPA